MTRYTCFSFALIVAITLAVSSVAVAEEKEVVIEVDGWELQATLNMPENAGSLPAVILCHQFNNERTGYEKLASLLAERGIASLRIDLRGHGESTNKGGINRDQLLTTWPDVVKAINYVKALDGINPDAIGTVSSSYSGEAVAKAGREIGYVQAYVVLSSGTLQPESIEDLKNSEAAWWFVAAKDDPRSAANMEKAHAAAKHSEMTIFESGGHGMNMFRPHSDLETKITDWFAEKLK